MKKFDYKKWVTENKMDKKKLKDVILKTLEKEGGAAGIKALAKASKVSKDKLEKSLSKMGGVKQHQDGDYISTPINEAETYIGSSYEASLFCSRCPCGCSEVIQDYQPAGGGDATYVKCKEDCTGQDATSVAAKMVDPRYRKPMRIREVKEIIEVMLDEKKKDRCHRKADSVYGTKTSAYKSGAIVKCRKGMIWKVGSKKKK